MNTEQLKRHIQKSDLTALEKRYLEGLVEAQTPREGMRLIDADDYCKKNGCSSPYGNDGECVNCCICDCPTIEAEPVRHGRWIEKYRRLQWCEDDVEVYFECSECAIENYYETRYCPNCGAKMDGKEGETE